MTYPTGVTVLQERRVSAQNVREVPVGFLHRVKKKSTVLFVISWQHSGTPNSVSFAGCDQFLTNPPTVTRASIAYISLVGTGSSPPVYGGPSGNTMGMAAVAVKGSDISVYQTPNGVYPHNVIAKVSGNVGRITVYAVELANFPAFRYRDIQVSTINNATAGTLSLTNPSMRPFSFDLVGACFATSSKQTVVEPWGGFDPRYFRDADAIKNFAKNMPFSMNQAVGLMFLMGGVRWSSSSFWLPSSNGFNDLVWNTSMSGSIYRALQLGVELPQGAGDWGLGGSLENLVGWSDWLSSQFILDLREGAGGAYYLAVQMFGGSGAYAVVFNRDIVSNPALLSSLDGEAPAIFQLVAKEAGAVTADIPLGVTADVLPTWSNTFTGDAILAPQWSGLPSALDEVGIRDLMGASERGSSDFVSGAVQDLFNILTNLAHNPQEFEDAVTSGEVEFLP